jgi:hypothetical protein
MQQKVFISYSSKDARIASSICAALETRGHRCWMSSRDVKPGENYQGAIVRAIRDAGVMVMVFSTNANNSDEIKKELALASQSKLMVIPVRAEDVLPSEDFTYELATRQWIDLFDDWERAIDQLGGQIDHAIPREAGSQAPAARAVGPKAAKSRTPLFIGIAAALLIAIAGGVWLMRPPPQPQRQAVEQPSPPAMDPAKLESDLWDSVKDSGDAAALNSYLAKYPAGLFAAAAKAKLVSLNKPAPETAKPVPAPVVKTATARPPAAQAKPDTASAPTPAAPVSASGLNPQVQQAVDMAHKAETQARAMAERAEDIARQAQAGTPGFGVTTVHGSAQLAGRLDAVQMGGAGVITYGNGDRYAGGTRNGQRFGLGVYTGAEARVYRERVGQFAADQLSGYAVVYRKDGRARIGQWKEGGLNGYGAVYDAQGRLAEQGLYANDTLTTPMTAN